MTVQSATSRYDYNCNGATTSFPVGFYFLADSHILVQLTNTLVTPQTTVDLVLNSDYTVTGAGNPSGGSVTALSTYPTGYKITILRNVPLTQLTDYVENSPFPAASHEAALDLLTMQNQMQDEKLDRAFLAPSGYTNIDLELPAPAAGYALGWDATGTSLVNVANSGASQLAQLADTASAANGDALIGVKSPLTGGTARTQHDKNQEFVSVKDFGAVGDGATDDSAAFAAAIAVARYVYVPFSASGYKIGATITITNDLTLDLQGSTLKPTGAINMLNSGSATQAASTTVSSGATRGSRSVVVASATNLAVGQWVKIDANDNPTNDASSYPSYWGKITGLVSTTVSLDRVLPVTYGGTITLQAFADASFKNRLVVRNGFIDGANVTSSGTSGSAIRACGFKRVLLEDITFTNFSNASGNVTSVQIYQCIDANIRNCTTRDQQLSSSVNFYDIQECRVGDFGPNNIIDGSSFGVNLTRCEVATAHSCHLFGRIKKEIDDAAGLRSTRGIKFYGCADPSVINCEVAEYDSPLKFEANFQVQAISNRLRNTRRNSGGNGIAINISAIISGAGTHQYGGVVALNKINSCGLGIGLQDNNTGLITVDANYIEDCDQYGIYANTKDVVVTNNVVKDWGANGSLIAGIYHTNGATIIGNRFSNSPQTTYPCINNNLSTSYKYSFRDNTCSTANPLFTSSQLAENSGSSSIASGSTSVTITHGLIKTPAASEISITWTNNTTTDPGNWWISGISSTQFTVNVRTAPGASTATFEWAARLAMPFTA